jgi:hypothetical protein
MGAVMGSANKKKRYVASLHRDQQGFGFVIRDSAGQCPAIHGFRKDVRAAVTVVMDLLKLLNA